MLLKLAGENACLFPGQLIKARYIQRVAYGDRQVGHVDGRKEVC